MATPSREAILKSAQVLVDQQKLGQAIQEYLRIVNADPHDTKTLLKIGDLQTRLERYQEAIATYDRVGRYYATQGFAHKAVAVFKQVHQLIKLRAPNLRKQYSDLLPELGRLLTEVGQTGEALFAYDEYAAWLQQAGREHEALGICLKMVALDGENPLPHLRLAEASCRVQALPEAIQSFWRAAELLLQKDRPDDAIKVIERILHFKPEPRFARAAAELYLRRGGHENGLQALAKLQICFKADPKNLDTLALLAHAFNNIGQEAKAVEVYKEMARLAREQDQPELLQQLLEHLRQVAPEAAGALRQTQPGAPRDLGTGPDTRAEARAPGTQAAPRPPSEPHAARWSDPAEIAVEESDIELLSDVPPRPRTTAPSVPPPRTKAPRLVLSTDLELAPDDAESSSEYALTPYGRKAIVDSESFRKLRLFGKAIETLHRAIEHDPLSIPIRQQLRDVLLDAGDRESALAEGLNIATIYADRGDIGNAEPLLRQFLEVYPRSEEGAALQAQIQEIRGLEAESSTTEATLELEEILSLPPPEPKTPGPDEPLPSFPLSLPPIAPAEAKKPAHDRIADSIEATLDEAEFYASQDLFEDAMAILKEQLKRYPTHPLLLERLEEVQELAANAPQARSQTVYRAEFKSKEVEELDIDASLDILDELGLEPDALAPEAQGMVQNEQIDVDQVFAQFKAGVAAQVSESDSATHYDLGVAYMEMGLLEDAISEFEVAARDVTRRCMCFAMVGMMHLEQERLEEAVSAYTKALDTPNKSIDQELNLHFDLGHVQELRGKVREALHHFGEVARRDPNFRNVNERIAALRPSQPPAGSVLDEEDEYERALNKLFN